jgi:hypothetical protein
MLPQRRRGSCITLATALMLMSAVLSGCSPDTRGAVAITVDSAGSPLAVIVTCGADFDAVELSSRPAGRDGDLEQIGLWSNDGQIDDGATLPLTGGATAEDWDVVTTWDGVMSPHRLYDIRAGQLSPRGGIVTGGSPVSSPFAFTGAQFEGLEPGELLRHVDVVDDPIAVRESVDEFRNDVCGET